MRVGRPIELPPSGPFATEAALKRCSLACKEVVAAYLSEEAAPRSEFGGCLLRAAAAIDAAAAASASEAERRSTFAIAAPICHAAAEQCRRSGLDPGLLRAAAACERAAAICEHQPAATDEPQRSAVDQTRSRAGRSPNEYPLSRPGLIQQASAGNTSSRLQQAGDE